MEIKKTVVDIHDLQDMLPFFKTKVGKWIGQGLLSVLNVEKVNRVHTNSCHLRGAAFTSAILADPLINVHYEVHNEKRLETLPDGAFFTVSNHPIGSIDGIMLIDIFAKRRPDYKVMVNGILAKISAMQDNFISVVPDSKNEGPNKANLNGLRASLLHLKEGHPLGFFPAGAISFYNKERKDIFDLDWKEPVIRLIRKGNVPIYPVYFDCKNSSFFYWLGRIDWRIRTVRIPSEAFNKQGKTMHIYIGKPISPEEIKHLKDDKELGDFLREATYAAKS